MLNAWQQNIQDRPKKSPFSKSSTYRVTTERWQIQS